MATHVFAYYVDDYNKVDVELPAVKDDVLTQIGDTRFLIPPGLNNIHWVHVAGANLTEAYLESPSLGTRRFVARVIPGNYGALALDLDKIPVMKPPRPIPLAATEQLAVKVSYGGTAAAPNVAVVALGPPTLPPVPAGDIILLKLTSSTPLVAGQWTTCVMTPEKALDVGTYALVGFIPISANAIAARAIITGQVNRPGVPAIAGSEPEARVFAQKYLDAFQFYEMGRFTHLTIPTFQFLSAAADTSETVYAYIIKVA